MTVFGVRLEARYLLVRCDIPLHLNETKGRIEVLLRGMGLDLAQEQADLGDIAAIQVAGIRGGVWDLWGQDQLSADDAIKRVVLGSDGSTALADGPLSDLGPGMSLDDLLDGSSGDQKNT